MEKSTTKANQFFKRVVADCGPVIKD
uniref:4c protein n=1 Tax=Infectious bronchitis virus TaxID=11120 RepID=A0A1L5YN78_9GAMC|nr:4c protein [Infectious bronchitis virus]